MPHKKNDNDLVAIRKNKGTLTVNKPTCIGMCILELSKILIYIIITFIIIIITLEINMVTIQDYYSQTLTDYHRH